MNPPVATTPADSLRQQVPVQSETLSKPTSYRSIWTYLATLPHTQAWVTTGGFKTRYVEAGKPGNPVLIMIHGTGGSWEGFCANLGPLSQHFHCFALDMVGCGFTEKPDYPYEISVHVKQLADFMDGLGLKQASFMGISMGSWIAARFALAHPDRTEKLILLSAFGLSDDEEEIGAILTRRGKAFDEPNWDNIKEVFNKLIYQEKNRLDDFIGLRIQTYIQPTMKAAGKHILSVFEPQFLSNNLITPEEWKQIKAPALVIASMHDRPLFVKTAYAVAKLIPDARLIEIEEVGHWPQFEKPEVLNEATIAFLSGEA